MDVNEKGDILNFDITQGNVDDRAPLNDSKFLSKIKGKLYGDKGYISAKLTQLLFVDGVQLITGIRDKMKNCLLELKDKILLRKRSIIETINDELKNICQVEHSRHRSFENFISNLITIGIMFVIKNYIVDSDKIHAQIQENKLKEPKKPSKFQQRLQVAMEQAEAQKAKNKK